MARTELIGTRGTQVYSERSNGSGSDGSSQRRGAKGDSLASRRVQAGRDAPISSPFILYVEGPGDCDILRSWARRVSRDLERAIANSSVILGGRQPARAVAHFRQARETNSDVRGLCVLDRDAEAESIGFFEAGLEFFTWPQRHIESYLLVPAAIGRHARRTRDVAYVERLVAKLRKGDEVRRGSGGIDAKRLLAPKGPLSRELGRSISPAGVARAMRRDEIHREVYALFDRVSDAAGLPSRSEPLVVRRVPRKSPPGE